ncbi:MAG: hypothetical protein NT154_20825, partial [Verrucomicrobia bacterium]|nr:hypothetical protein [Verrucomicrobiota bacterium]
VFNAESNVTLTVHPGPHVFNGQDFWPKLSLALGGPSLAVGPVMPPDDASAVAWMRFTDAPESLDGAPYHWLGRSSLHLAFDTRPQSGDAIEIGWGSKADERVAVLVVNGKSLTVQAGGHWGFRWLRVPIPAGLPGDHYDIDIRSSGGTPAFLSEIRITSPVGDPSRPSLSQPAFKAKLTLGPATATSEIPANAEAFPAMRKVWDREPPDQWPTLSPGKRAGDRAGDLDASSSSNLTRTRFRQAETNARLANEAFFRCRRYIDGWLAHCDSVTGLFPRNLRESNYWNGRDSAADNYPFMVLTAAMTDRPLMQGRLLDILHTETRLTSRLGRLPDDYSFVTHSWRREKLDLDAIIFDGAEYVKDGLLYIAEWVGPSPWTERMVGITEDIWKYAPVETPYGKIPTLNFEVCGDMLQASARMFWFTGDRKYLDYAVRLGDFFLLGTNHPTRDFKQLRLIDHGCEVINGLSELYVAVSYALPEKKKAYEQPLHEMFDCILAKGRNADGLFYVWFNPQTGEHSADLCDTWGYDYDGVYTLWLLDKTVAYRDAVRKALSRLHGKYVGACWADKSADGFADSIEGAINLINREPDDSAADWVDSQTRMMWSIQKPDGIIEAWHGDGN